jgi:hypothetical protein
VPTGNEGAAIPPPEPGRSLRTRWGWVATIVGFLVILAGVLHLTSATVGGRVREFKDRRTYNEVKTATHRAIPVTALLGFVGMGLVVLGGKLRASGAKETRSG